MGQRPELPERLQKALQTQINPAMDHSDSTVESVPTERKTLNFLVDLFQQCTQKNPADRPDAQKIYQMLLKHFETKSSN